MADVDNVIEVGSVEFIGVPVRVDGTLVTNAVQVSVVPAGQPHGTWVDPITVSGKLGVLIDASVLPQGSYWVWAKVSANPETPIIKATRFIIASSSGWSYNPPVNGLYGTDVISELRFLVKDTTHGTASLTDEEVRYFVAQWRAKHPEPAPLNLQRIASDIALSMADSYVASAKVSKTVGDTSISREYGGEADRYRDLAKRLAAAANDGATTSTGFAGMGLAAAQPDAIFAIGHMDYNSGRSAWHGRG